MYNTTSYENYVVFYYNLSEAAAEIILNDLYSQRAIKDNSGMDNTENSLSKEELDFISVKVKEAFNAISQKVARWRVDGLLSYEYGKLNIAPDDTTTGDVVLFRINFELYQKTEEMFSKIDMGIMDFVTSYVLARWAYLTNQADWQGKQAMLIQATESFEDAMAFRNTPPKIKQVFF